MIASKHLTAKCTMRDDRSKKNRVHTKPKMPPQSAFARAVSDVVVGGRQAHELALVLVGEAVRVTLSRIAADYPLDYTLLLKTYEQPVVTACCGAFEATDENATCCMLTKTGKQCTRRALVHGVCTQHLGAWRLKQETTRAQDAYVATIRHAHATDPHAEELRRLTRKRTICTSMPHDVAECLKRHKGSLEEA